MSQDLIFQIDQLTFRSVPASDTSHPAKDFISALDEPAYRDLLVAAHILASSCASGRPPSNRAERVSGSRRGLFELRITPPGRKGPHHRLLYVRERNTIWVLRGLTKRESLSRNEIEAAERLLARWRARQRE
jgi:hypothetical protein